MRSHASRIAATPSITCSIPNDGAIQPCPAVAARVKAAGASPPKSRPGRSGGSAGMGPLAPAGLPSHTACIAATMASIAAPSPRRDTPLAS
jgi:hypothetical protein